MQNMLTHSEVASTALNIAARLKQLVQDNQPAPSMSDLLLGAVAPPSVANPQPAQPLSPGK